MLLPASGRVLGLDIGDARTGLASASVIARLPEPIETLLSLDSLFEQLLLIIEREQAELIVIGLPRNMQGEETQQSKKIRTVGDKIAKVSGKPIVFVDESLSSRRADELLKTYKGASQDSISACFILKEFFDTMEEL